MGTGGADTVGPVRAVIRVNGARVITKLPNVPKRVIQIGDGVSGLAVRMTKVIRQEIKSVEVIELADGRLVPIFNAAQVTGTVGHSEAITKLARELAETGDYEYIGLDLAWRTMTRNPADGDPLVSLATRPDIIAVHRNGHVSAYEIPSNTDSVVVLQGRLDDGEEALGLVGRDGGVYEVKEIADILTPEELAALQ
jgi:hypothetical protein